ncbi:MAG: hypothetical protein AVDCRST_MAG88-1306, partial [uncultured Thermomicrobiales bacterium]
GLLPRPLPHRPATGKYAARDFPAQAMATLARPRPVARHRRAGAAREPARPGGGVRRQPRDHPIYRAAYPADRRAATGCGGL